eukprot:1159242-Pelagomonas_calceolata.AAC.12
MTIIAIFPRLRLRGTLGCTPTRLLSFPHGMRLLTGRRQTFHDGSRPRHVCSAWVTGMLRVIAYD